MNATERRQQLRAILAGDRCVYAAPVHDPISARIAEDLGFEVGFVSNRIVPATVLCVPPDTGLMTLTEQAQHFRNMCRATSNLSLMVGVHDGYGHALNVARTVEEMENAGVSAILIMDSETPLRFGHSSVPPTGLHLADVVEPVHGPEWIIPLEETVGKLKAAIAARQDPSLVIIYKTFAQRDESLGIPDVIRRIKAAEEVGVDGFHLTTIGRPQIEAVQGVTKLPLIRGYGTAESGEPGQDGRESQQEHLQYLASKGFRVVNPAHYTIWAETKACYDVLKGLRDGVPIEELRKAYQAPELEHRVVIRRPKYDEMVKLFMN